MEFTLCYSTAGKLRRSMPRFCEGETWEECKIYVCAVAQTLANEVGEEVVIRETRTQERLDSVVPRFIR